MSNLYKAFTNAMKLKIVLVSIPFLIAACTQSEEVKKTPTFSFALWMMPQFT